MYFYGPKTFVQYILDTLYACTTRFRLTTQVSSRQFASSFLQQTKNVYTVQYTLYI